MDLYNKKNNKTGPTTDFETKDKNNSQDLAEIENEEMEIESIERMRAEGIIGPGRGTPITDPDDLALIQRVKNSIANKRGRPPRQHKVVPVFMKWPEQLLNDVRTEAEKLNLPYQHFIRMVMSEYIIKKKA